MHTTLTGRYKGFTGDTAEVRQGHDDFLSQNRSVIMASNRPQTYKNPCVIPSAATARTVLTTRWASLSAQGGAHRLINGLL
jgi:hypothetical protein